MTGVTHIVQIQFKDGMQAEVVEACDRMLELKNSCVHPSTGKTYIKSSKGGAECSIEGFAGGLTHVFVVEFESVADRDYYALKDPFHLAYAASLGPIVDKVQVTDFAAGVF